MTVIASEPGPKPGRLRRILATIGAWVQSLDYTATDYAFDRIENLEAELAALKEQLLSHSSPTASDGRSH